MMKEFVVRVEKVSHGIVFGYAMVSAIDGEPYEDTQGDIIPDEVIMKASIGYMLADGPAREMHRPESIGRVLFALPLTADVAEALEINPRMTGLIIGMKPTDEVLRKFESGEYTGFSIGGMGVSTDA